MYVCMYRNRGNINNIHNIFYNSCVMAKSILMLKSTSMIWKDVRRSLIFMILDHFTTQHYSGVMGFVSMKQIAQ